jgi:hypothetical protein
MIPAMSVLSCLPGCNGDDTAGGTEPAGDGSCGRVLVVDTDMGLDDVRAVFALVGSPVIEIAAFCTVDGSASAAKGADNLIGLLESADAPPAPIYRGLSGGADSPPPWRGRAEGLAGHPFPPPRALSHAPLEGADTPPGSQPGSVWLALGPLSNLAALELRVPGTLRDMEIWMPVSLDGDTVSGWNLEYDSRAAELVMDRAGKIVLVDAAWKGDPGRLLRDVEGDAPAARWIMSTTGGLSGSHSFLFDEIAAAALIAPGLFERAGKAYEPAGFESGRVTIAESDDGRIEVIGLKEGASLEGKLHGAWEMPGTGLDGHVHLAQAPADPVAFMRQFHGHLGPFVVLGYRMGRIALEEAGSSGHFGISAEVHSVLVTPRSCLIDGVQLGSGCTLGKRNITVEAFDGEPWAVFRTSGGTTVTVSLLPGITSMVKEAVAGEGVEQAGLKVWDMSDGELFSVTVGD